jgi:hypothetical protein
MIPPFANGAIATFTISQTGMVVHWRNVLRGKRGRGQRQRVQVKLFLNGVGATATVTALAVIVIAKFAEGGWITIVAIPCVIVLLKSIHRYYSSVDTALRDDDQLQFRPSKPPFVLVMTKQWDHLTIRHFRWRWSFRLMSLRCIWRRWKVPDVGEQERKLREQWAKDVEDSAVAAQASNLPRLVFLSAPFRRMLLKLIDELQQKDP